MLPAPHLPDEAGRLAALRASKLLDTPPEERFDRVTRLLSHLLGAPIALVSLVDEDRQWFKSRLGLDVPETDRAPSFCGHAIQGDELFVVPDAAADERFHDNPLVTGEPWVRFYAGQPLHGAEGHRIGSLCVIDRKPRALSGAHRLVIADLAAIVEREMQLTDVTALQRQVIDMQAEAERLLLCILPAAVARDLRGGPRLIAEHYERATILFADIVGFSDVAARLPASKTVRWLNEVFTAIDELAARRGVERIKTIGDAYMAATGVPVHREDQVEAMAGLALAIQDAAACQRRPDGEPLQMRVGIHVGPLVAGVIGTTRFAYDLWGHTVNICSRLEGSAPAGAILVSASVREALGDRFRFEPFGTLELKGVGEVSAFRLGLRNNDPNRAVTELGAGR